MVRQPRGRAGIRIYNEDCITGIGRRITPESVSVIVTSPPYNLRQRYSKYKDDLEPKQYLEWIARVSRACNASLAEDGSFFLNIGNKPSDPWWPMKVAEAVMTAGFELQNTILWIKSIAISQEDVGSDPAFNGDIAVGHFKPVNSRRFLNGLSEYVFHLTKHGDVSLDKLAVGVPYQDKTNVGRWKGATADLRDRGNVWFIPYDTIHSSRAHPCIFPVKLPEMCIRLHGLAKTKLVLDPFMGTGTTALACDRLGLPCVGFDIDEKYVALAKRSLALQREARSEAAAAHGVPPGFEVVPRELPNLKCAPGR